MAAIKKPNGGSAEKKSNLICGLVMPISPIDGCSAEHWADVKSIITEAIESITEPSFAINLVSDADDVGVIQKRIVQNLYATDVLICDVSGKNPNVMFELGMRLAFDKPTVIVKDDKTDYSFDTSVIEHISYPRDLRFNNMVAFKSVLADKVVGTHRAATSDPAHSTFLKNFGKFSVVSLDEDVIPADQLVVELLTDLQSEVARLRRMLPRAVEGRGRSERGMARLYVELARFFSEEPSLAAMNQDLLRDEAFISDMENRCEAPRYFTGPAEFKDALRRATIAFLEARDL